MVTYPELYPNLFNRYVRVFFFLPDGSQLLIDYEQLDIYFKISRTDARDADKCDIEIYNLSKKTRDKLNQNCRVEVFAGYYKGIFDIVFRGDITAVYTVEGGTDVCTYVKCADNTRSAIDTAYKTKTYKAGTKFVDIIRQELKDWNDSIRSDPRFASTLFAWREISEGEIEDPNEYYKTRVPELAGRFVLDKDETKTQTPYGVIWDIVNRTNGIIWAGQKATHFDKEDQKKTSESEKEGDRVSWTFYLQEPAIDAMTVARFVHVNWTSGDEVVLNSANGLLDISPVDNIDRSKGWTAKCLLNPLVKVGNNIICVPARKKEWPEKEVKFRVIELSHEHADGSVYYTTVKGKTDTGDPLA